MRSRTGRRARGYHARVRLSAVGGRHAAADVQRYLSQNDDQCGYYKEDILRQLSNARLPEDWNDLPAVRAGEVWATDATAYFSRPGPRVVEAVEILAKILHPEIFGQPDSLQAVRVPAHLMKS